MKTTKYEIELPTVPYGFEVVGQGIAQAGDMAMRYTVHDGWHWCAANEFSPFNILARRKRTLADWANEQPLFKALAEARKNHKATDLIYSGGGSWTMTNPDHIGGVMGFTLGAPASGLFGKLTLKNGKWEDAT